MAVILLLLYGNLRGIREAGSYFAIPTYFFIFSLASVIVIGFVKEALGTLHYIPLPPASEVYGGKIGTPGRRLADGAGLHLPAALVRQRRVVAHGTRGHLQRGEQLPEAGGQARPPDAGGHELDAGLPGAGRDAAGPVDPRRPLRQRDADGGVAGGPGGLRDQPGRPPRLLRRAAGHHAHPLHRRQHELQRVPLPGQLRGRRPLPAAPADAARPSPRLLQRDPRADGRGPRPRARVQGAGRRAGGALRHRRVHRLHHGRARGW